jgi:hypothetical protein
VRTLPCPGNPLAGTKTRIQPGLSRKFERGRQTFTVKRKNAPEFKKAPDNAVRRQGLAEGPAETAMFQIWP